MRDMRIKRHIDTLLHRFEKDFVTHNQIEVSKSALLHNLDLFTSSSAHQVIPVLKANAYGHGIEQVATILKDRKLPYIAVDGYFEALRIRDVSQQPVLVMGAILPQNYAHMKYDNFTFVVHDAVTIHAIGKTGEKVKVHLECNTGMNRYGAHPDEAADLAKLILSYKNLTFEGIMSHLADSDSDDYATVEDAVKIFDQCIEQVRAVGAKPTIIHIAQSAGSLKAQSEYANTMRLGIALYGINPFSPDRKLYSTLTGLRPALRLTSTITQIVDLKKGDKVSYNYTFTAPKNMRIGVLPLGYYEAINRALSNKGTVKIGKKFAPIVGRVCMNHTMINLDDIRAAEGDKVIVYSDDPRDKNSIDAIARQHDLFNYNLLTALSSDMRHIIVD